MARRPAEPGIDRRQQILEAALDLFAEQGFEGATNKEIAARADVTTGLLYFYFRSKEDLFLAAFQHQAQQVFDEMFDVFADAGSEQPPELVIRRVIGRFIEQIATPRSLNLIRIVLRNFAHGDDGAESDHEHGPLKEARCLIRDQAQRASQMFREYLDDQIARGALRPVNTAMAAQLVMNGAMLTVMRWHKGETTLSRDEMIDAMVDICLHGLLPSSDHHIQARARGTPPPRRRAFASARRS